MRDLPKRRSTRWAIVFAVFAVLTGLWLMPLFLNFGDTVLGGGPSDATATLRTYWAAERLGDNPFTFRRDALMGAPEGVPNTPAAVVANPVQPGFVWALKGLAGLTGAWTLFLFLGFVLTGFLTFLLLEQLGIHPLAAFFGAYVFAFNPWQFEKAFVGHAGLTQSWVLPLMLLALLHLRRARSLLSAALAGLVLAVVFYVNTYFGLFALVLTSLFMLADLLWARGFAERLWRFTLADVAFAATAVAIAPAAVYYVTDATESAAIAKRSIEDLQLFGAAPLAYVVPSERHPLFGDRIAELWSAGDTRHFAEPTLFFGYTTIVLALAAVVLLCLRHASLRAHGEHFFTAVVAVTLVVTAFVASLPRLVEVLGVEIPTPSYLIGEITTTWRVYARFGVLVGFGLVLLATLTLHVLAQRRWGRALAAAGLALVAFELAPGFPIQTWRVDAPPTHAAWLARHPGGIVAHYPTRTDRPLEDTMEGEEFYNQVFHGHPLHAVYGVSLPNSRQNAVRTIAKFPTDHDTAGILAAQGVRYVVVHDDVYCGVGETPPRLGPGFRKVATFPDTRIFQVDAAPLRIDQELREYAFDGALALGAQMLPVRTRGFYRAEVFAGEPGRWLGQGARLRVNNPNPAGTFLQLSFVGFSAFRTRRLVVMSGSRVLASGTVEQFAKDLTFGPFVLPPGASTVRLVATPGPERLAPTDSRIASVFVRRLSLRPVLDYSTWGIGATGSTQALGAAARTGPGQRPPEKQEARLASNDPGPDGDCLRPGARVRA